MNIFAISLGCAKNRIDTELALGSVYDGFNRVNIVNDVSEADILIVNTCAFIEEAVSESIETILELAEKKGPSQKIIVMGCMVNRYRQELIEELPEVDFFLDTEGAPLLGQILRDHDHAQVKLFSGSNLDYKYHYNRILTTPPWRAYVKISEGCSNYCTYCMIPRLRGPQLSRNFNSIIEEVRKLGESGVREVTLIAQDLTAYEAGGKTLPDLLEQLSKENCVDWIRLLYLHPSRITKRLLKIIAENPSICPYLDIPVQHASSNVLKRMGRGYDYEDLCHLFDSIREIIPNAALRTTVMVGFPGETEDDFEQLKHFIEEYRFNHLGCFVYSDEEECPAHQLKNKVDVEMAEERKREIMELQAEISSEINDDIVGTLQDVLVEGVSPETDLLLIGRTKFQAPEIDGVTYINEGNANPGDIKKVRITDSHTYDLVGGIAE